MQSKQTNRLSRKIRKIREKKTRGKLTRWVVVCEKLNIRTAEGNLDPGLAYKIGYQEYEPSDREIRKRLGLNDICTKCRRVFRATRPPEAKKPMSPARAWWNGLKSGDREKLIELSYKNFLDWKNRR